ncbi:MAG: hypothetical protein NTV11_09535, partial [Rhodocyclales bacterium]|nr:hypothetical protein [Rhodocyclales bacterium]
DQAGQAERCVDGEAAVAADVGRSDMGLFRQGRFTGPLIVKMLRVPSIDYPMLPCFSVSLPGTAEAADSD